jgi:hypothetical protein
MSDSRKRLSGIGVSKHADLSDYPAVLYWSLPASRTMDDRIGTERVYSIAMSDIKALERRAGAKFSDKGSLFRDVTVTLYRGSTASYDVEINMIGYDEEVIGSELKRLKFDGVRGQRISKETSVRRSEMDNDTIVRELVAAARLLVAAEEETGDEGVDEQFAVKLRGLRQGLAQLASKKNKKLRQYGIDMIRPNSTVEELIDAVIAVTKGAA